MNAPVTTMQAKDWFLQFDAQMNGDTETMVGMVKPMPTRRLTQYQRECLLTMYMKDKTLKDRLCTQRRGVRYQVDNNEARVIIKLKTIEDEIVQEWISTLWSNYVMCNSLRNIAENNDTFILQSGLILNVEWGL